MIFAAHLGPLRKDDAHIVQRGRILAKAAAGDCCRIAALTRFRETPIDESVLGEIRMHGDIEKTALTCGNNIGNTLDRFADTARLRDDAHLAATFSDDHAAIGKEIDRPGMGQSIGDHIDSDLALLCVESFRSGGRDDPEKEQQERQGNSHIFPREFELQEKIVD
jgi:hypothetical protein